MSNIEAFGSFTTKGVRQTQNEMDSSDWIKFDKRVTKFIRLLPPLAGEGESPWVIIHQHFIKIPGGKAVPFNCPRKMRNERCPACDKYDKLMSTGNPHDESLARREYRANTRAIARAIDRDNPDAGVRPVGLSTTILRSLNHYREKLEIDFTDPMEGYDLAIEYLGEQPWYRVEMSRQSSPIAKTDTGLEDVIKQMNGLSLQPFAKVLAYDDIVNKLREAQGNAQGGSASFNDMSSPAPKGLNAGFDSNNSNDPF